MIDLEDADVEPLFSVQDDEPTVDAILALGFEDFSTEELDHSGLDSDFIPYDVHCLAPACLDSTLACPDPIFLIQPLAKVQILLGKYEKPIFVIAFFDTGVVASIINPSLLPRFHWQECFKLLDL